MSVHIPNLPSEDSNYVTDNTENEKDHGDDSPHPALLNHVIVHHIFENLNISDFKTGRSVCSKWKRFSESSFKKKVRICFHIFSNTESNEIIRYKKSNYLAPENIKEFFKMSHEEFPFTAVTFQNRLPWMPTELTEFFLSEGRFITDLRLVDVALKVEKGSENINVLKTYDLATLLPEIANLKHLTITRYYETVSNTTQFSISYEDLTKIPHIHLERCRIDLTTQSNVLSPVKLFLELNHFYRNNNLLKTVLLNDFVHFEVMEELKLTNSSAVRDEIYSNISLDVSGNIFLKALELDSVNLLNFQKSFWNIDTCTWTSIPFSNRTSMVIKELTIAFSECALKFLPTSVEKLTLGFILTTGENQSSEEWNFSMPKIKQLQLKDRYNVKICLPYLKSCFSNLEELVIETSLEQRVQIDLCLIPSTLKFLTLKCGNYNLVGQGCLALEKLWIKRCYNEQDLVLATLKYFSPKHFVWIIRNLNGEEPVLKTIMDTSIPNVTLESLNSKSVKYLRDKYTFDCFNESSKLGVMVNEKGGTVKVKGY